MPKPREHIRDMKAYQPPIRERAEYLCLDFNENLAGPSPNVLERLKSLTAEDLSRYPDMGRVLDAVASHFQVKPENVCVTNGADEAIQCCVNAYAENGFSLMADPGYSMYRVYFESAGIQPSRVNYEGQHFQFPLSALEAELEKGIRFVILGSPNNPTGGILPLTETAKLMKRFPETLFVIDEAYAEFSGNSFLSMLKQHENLVILRTFSKVFGLAGLRVGCALSSSDVISTLQKVRSPYSVDTPSLIGLEAALSDIDYMKSYVREVRENRETLKSYLENLGFSVVPSEANFLLFRTATRDMNPSELWGALKARGILARLWPYHPVLKDYLRVTVGREEENEMLMKALQEIVS